MWEGSIDRGGSFFGLSTCYDIIRKANPSYRKDYERTHRFSCNRDVMRKRHHQFTFRVYLKSMNLRYKIELLIFILMMIGF